MGSISAVPFDLVGGGNRRIYSTNVRTYIVVSTNSSMLLYVDPQHGRRYLVLDSAQYFDIKYHADLIRYFPRQSMIVFNFPGTTRLYVCSELGLGS